MSRGNATRRLLGRDRCLYWLKLLSMGVDAFLSQMEYHGFGWIGRIELPAATLRHHLYIHLYCA